MGILSNLFKKETDKEITVLVNDTKLANNIANVKDTVSNILDEWDFEDSKYEYDALDHRELLIRLEQKDLENLELKNELSYYKRYVQFIEDNYILILRNNQNIKEIFDNLIGGKYE